MSIQSQSGRRAALLLSAAVLSGCKKNSPPAVHVRSSDEIRVGVVGCGARGRGAATQAVQSSPNVRITALADLFPHMLDRTLQVWADRPKEQYDLSRDRCFVGFDAYHKILETDINYVILTTPPGFRPLHMRAAVEAGKHVYLEKAIAVDPVGVRTIIAASEMAKQKNLGVMAGTWRRHDPVYIETIKRIQDGAIGRILGAHVHFLHNGFNAVPRKSGWSDVEWQIRNFPYFTWLSGDFIVEHHVHQHDVVCWALGTPPRLALGMGGRQARVGEIHGHVYDHFAVDYEYENGMHVHSFCRQMDGASIGQGERFFGERGWAEASGKIQVEGKDLWRMKPSGGDAWVKMHADLIGSIRAGTPINEGAQSAQSHLMSIMGRMSAYTGQIVRWTDASKSSLDLMPKDLKLGPLPVPPVAIPGALKEA